MGRKGWIITITVFVVLAAVILFGRIADDTAPGVSPSAKTQIDRLAAQHDCAGLQAFFDATSDSAAGQLSYIDDKMRDAGCYDD